MSIARSKRRGFTIIEAVVAAAVTAIGVVSVIRAIGALTLSQARVNDSEMMQRLAYQKFEEIVAIQDFTTPSGDFTDHHDSDHLWEMDTTPASIPQASSSTSATSTSASSAGTNQNLVILKVTVHPANSHNANDQAVVSGLVYEPPQTTSVANPTGGATGGTTGTTGGP